MKTVEQVILVRNLRSGDTIVEYSPGATACRVKREVPTALADEERHVQGMNEIATRIWAGEYSDQTLPARAEDLANMVLRLDEHMRAGGQLPTSWCSGENERGHWEATDAARRIGGAA